MANLEKYMKDHRDEFDSGEPEPGHFRRFEERLAASHIEPGPASGRGHLLKVAALILLLISVSAVVFDFATKELREKFAGRGEAELPFEISEAVNYYDNQASVKMAVLEKLAVDREDGALLTEAAAKEIRDLDAATNDLKRSIAMNPGNEQIFDAIIRNQQMKETYLNTLINQLSHTK
jgi:hypothetical protein